MLAHFPDGETEAQRGQPPDCPQPGKCKWGLDLRLQSWSVWLQGRKCLLHVMMLTFTGLMSRPRKWQVTGHRPPI